MASWSEEGQNFLTGLHAARLPFLKLWLTGNEYNDQVVYQSRFEQRIE